MANKREHEALGYENGELVGKTIFDIYGQQMHTLAREGLKKIMERGSHPVTFTVLFKKDGTMIRCDIASSAIYDDDGKFVSSISALRQVDNEELLKNLAGIVDDKDGPLSKYVSSLSK